MAAAPQKRFGSCEGALCWCFPMWVKTLYRSAEASCQSRRRKLNDPALQSPPVHSSGGCNPALTQCWRAVTTVALFIRNASTVARPQAVLPIIRVPSSLHAKCCDHFWRRGLNNDIRRPVSKSRACVWVPLNSLQLRHDSQRFSSSDVPPYTSGVMCSTVNDIPDTASRVNQ